ncbi:Nucleotidylyl transferase [Pelomyxa schiedti]|nr:Nucleotidylyl transferase [Pelomyxa schiedti]
MTTETRRPRIWLDGCFDLTHWGHANVIRQARVHVGGDPYVVVGVHEDQEIARVKHTPPVCTQAERYAAVRAIRWVDEVVEAVPYSPSLPLMRKHNIDFVIHGDDIAVDTNGRNCYEEIISAGMMKIVPRTEGVSTTDLIQRMLDSTTGNLGAPKLFMLSARRITEFGGFTKKPLPSDVLVYTDGVFDLLHAGHIEFLRRSKELGTYLVVGIFDDEEVKRRTGKYPIMSLHERVMSVMACKYVDDVVIGAPAAISKDMITAMNLRFITHGLLYRAAASSADPYVVPKEMGLYREISSESTLTTEEIANRVARAQAEYQERNLRKASSH